MSKMLLFWKYQSKSQYILAFLLRSVRYVDFVSSVDVEHERSTAGETIFGKKVQFK